MNKLLFALGVILSSVFYLPYSAQAWSGPTSLPPLSNTPTPVTVGTTDQTKDAGLTVGGPGLWAQSGIVAVGTPSLVGTQNGDIVAQRLCLGMTTAVCWDSFPDLSGGHEGFVLGNGTSNKLAKWGSDGTTITNSSIIDTGSITSITPASGSAIGMYVDNTTGNVSIGTSNNGGKKLLVQGNAWISGDIRIGGDAIVVGDLTTGGTFSPAELCLSNVCRTRWVWKVEDNDPPAYTYYDKSVGIGGVPSTTYKLDVTGLTRLRSSTGIGGDAPVYPDVLKVTGSSEFTGGVNIGGNLNVTGSYPQPVGTWCGLTKKLSGVTTYTSKCKTVNVTATTCPTGYTYQSVSMNASGDYFATCMKN